MTPNDMAGIGREGSARDAVRVTAELRSRYEAVAKVADAVPGALYLHHVSADGRSRFAYASAGFEEIFALPRDAVLQDASTFFARLHHDDAGPIRVSIHDAVRSTTPWSLEYRVVLPDGRQHWVLDRARLDRLPDGTTLCHGFITDITARKQIEEDLLQSEQRRELALLGADLGLWDWDLPKGELRLDDRCCEMLGFTTAELEPSSSAWLAMMHPDDTSRVEQILDRHWRGELAAYEAEFRLRHKAGHYVWVLSRGRVLVWDDDGRPTRMVGTRMDVSDRKAAEQALIEAKHAAEAAGRAKATFLATMSHEIRTPMNGVVGFAELLMDTPLSAEQRGYAQAMKDSGLALLTIINDVLDLSKIDAGLLTVERIPMSLAEAVRSVTELMRGQAQKKSIDLRAEYAQTLPSTVMCDPSRVRQVLINFVGNAIKFTEWGRITVRALDVQVAGSRHVRLEVQDTGIGISTDAAARLFQPFTQADSSTTRRYGGTGLGLSISKRLAELMGGQVGVDSQPGVGSTFWCVLPIVDVTPEGLVDRGPDASPHASAATVPSRTPNPSGEPALGLRILVAEDTPVNQMLVRRLLEKFGCEYDLASNGREAMALFEAGHYDLVLMDCQMPEVDGFEATAAIRALERARAMPRRTPVIAVTAGVLEEDRQRCVDAGMDDFCMKPIVARALREILERWRSSISAIPAVPAGPVGHRSAYAEDRSSSTSSGVR